jgi:hypothetical protein
VEQTAAAAEQRAAAAEEQAELVLQRAEVAERNCEHAHDEYRAAMHEVCAARAAAATVAGELDVATRAAASSAMRCVELDGEWQLEASAHAEALREVCQQLRTMMGIWRSSCKHRASKPCAWRRSPRS